MGGSDSALACCHPPCWGQAVMQEPPGPSGASLVQGGQDGEEVGALDLGTGIAGCGVENGFIRDRKSSLG